MFIADFGELALILPAFAAAAAILLLHRRYREVAAWGGALVGCIVVTAALKAGIGPFKTSLFGHGIRSASLPSGHAGLAVVFYGGLALLLWYGAGNWFGRLLAAALLIVETLVVTSVFVLSWHPVIDVLTGLALGAMCLVMLYPHAGRQRRSWTEAAAVCVAVLVLVSALHGVRIDDKELANMLMHTGESPRG
jgi:hypothetical protein